MKQTIHLVLLIAIFHFTYQQRKTPPSKCPHNCHCTETANSDIQELEASCLTFPDMSLPSHIAGLKVESCPSKLTGNVLKVISHITRIHIPKCGITELGTELIKNETKIIQLNLEDNNIENINVGTFLTNEYLQILFLDGNNISSIQKGAFFHLKALKTLNLRRNKLTYIPVLLPEHLMFLDLNKNLISVINESFEKESLVSMDLCENAIKHFPVGELIFTPKLMELCLGNEGVTLAANSSSHIQILEKLSFLASAEKKAALPNYTLSEVAHLYNLQYLSMSNLKLASVLFLQNLTKLLKLELVNITVTVLDVENVFKSKPNLGILSMDGSRELAHSVLSSNTILARLIISLVTLSLRNTGLSGVPDFHLHYQHSIYIDLSQNPLNCDCSMHQSVYFKPLEQILNKDETLCISPVTMSLADFLASPYCTGKYNDTYTNNLTGPSTVYTVIYVLVAILLLLTLILVSTYIICKRGKLSTRIEPCSMPPREQSMQQLQQASSEDMLLDTEKTLYSHTR